MNYQPVKLPYLNPCPGSTGLVMYEHWEFSHNRWNLLAVASSPSEFNDEPGDLIVTRRWGPAGEPVYRGRAK